MKKYDVTGIGNAVVDIEFRVADRFLLENGVEKGVTTLVGEERQNLLMKGISSKEAKKQAGGSAANTIVATSQFGGRSFYCFRVADDELGHFYLQDLVDSGVDIALSKDKLQPGVTGKCLVMVTEDSERTMHTFLGITQDFSVRDLYEPAIRDSQYLFVEGYLVTSPNGKEAMLHAKNTAKTAGTQVALTFSDPGMVKYFRANFEEFIGSGVDLLFANEEEAMLYTGKNTLGEAMEEMKKIARHFVLTMGKDGAVVFDGDRYTDIEPYPTKAIDSSGAGDMFAGAFLYGITHGLDYAASGKLASKAGSRVVGQFGPRLTQQEVKDILLSQSI